MKRFSVWLMTAVLMASAGGRAMAQGTAPMPPGPPLLLDARLAAVLGLTDEQQAVWATSREDLETMVRPLLKQAWSLQQEIERLLAQASPDSTGVGQRVIALHKLRTQLHDAHQAADEEFATLLTPEQKAKFEAFKVARPGPVVMYGVPHGPMDTR